jgi:hypothetical protein
VLAISHFCLVESCSSAMYSDHCFFMFLSINNHSKFTCEFTCWSNACFMLDCFPCYFHGSWWSQGHMQRLGPVAIPHSATSGKPHQTMLGRWFYNCSYSEQPLDFLRQNWVPEFANLRFSHFFVCIMPRGYKTWPTKSCEKGRGNANGLTHTGMIVNGHF